MQIKIPTVSAATSSAYLYLYVMDVYDNECACVYLANGCAIETFTHVSGRVLREVWELDWPWS